MITVRVNYFAAFREATGIQSEDIETDCVTVSSLFSQCSARHAGLHSEPDALVAINDEMSDWQAKITDGDVVLFFPPVAGG